jgi:hypothetical protein
MKRVKSVCPSRYQVLCEKPADLERRIAAHRERVVAELLRLGHREPTEAQRRNSGCRQ